MTDISEVLVQAAQRTIGAPLVEMPKAGLDGESDLVLSNQLTAEGWE